MTATIHQAAGRGALSLVRQLIEESPQLVNARDNNGRTPLMHACQWGCYPVVLFLLDHGAAVNKVRAWKRGGNGDAYLTSAGVVMVFVFGLEWD
jgi:ankyrin repeat protein